MTDEPLLYFPQTLTGIRTRGAYDLFGSAFSDQFTTRRAALRSQVDHPISYLDQFQIMLDYQHAIACIHQPLQHSQQTGRIGQVQAGGGFIE